MKRAFFSNFLLLLGVNLLVKVTYIFGIDRSVQNTVGTEVYGRYFTLLSLAMLLQIIADFGLAYYNSHKVAGHPPLVSKYFPNLLLLKLFLAGGYLLSLIGLGFALGYAPRDLPLLSLLAVNQVLVSFLLFLRSTLAALGDYRKDSLLSAFDKLLLVLFGGFLLFGPFRANFQIIWFVLAQTLSLLLALATVWLALRPHLPDLQWRFRKSFVALMLRRSTPYAMTVLLMVLYTRSDVIMLERLLPKGAIEAGIYAGGYRLLDAANMLGFLFAGLLLPMFSGMLGRQEDIRPLFDLALRLIFAIATSVGITVFFFQAEVVKLLYVESTPYWGVVLGWLMLTFIITSLSYIYGPLITAGDMISRLNRYYAYSILLNVVLNLLLIFRFGAAGAAFATFLTQGFVLLIQARLCQKRWPGLLRSSQFVQMALFTLLAVLSATAFHRWHSLPWLPAFALALSLEMLLAFAIQLLSLPELWKMLSAKTEDS